jgi:hypothetical protein
MTVGASTYLANSWLDALCNNTSFAVATVYVQLHVGDPGSAGTSNAAVETDREAATFAAASSGTIANDAPVSWTVISGSEDATHFSLWDASSAGNFLGSGTITANAYTAGDTYTAGIGALTLSLPVAS